MRRGLQMGRVARPFLLAIAGWVRSAVTSPPLPPRQGMSEPSPMESDDDTFTMETFGMSRSWDDIEGARSILNLNSPSAFHPVAEHAGAPPQWGFATRASAAQEEIRRG